MTTPGALPGAFFFNFPSWFALRRSQTNESQRLRVDDPLPRQHAQRVRADGPTVPRTRQAGEVSRGQACWRMVSGKNRSALHTKSETDSDTMSMSLS